MLRSVPNAMSVSSASFSAPAAIAPTCIGTMKLYQPVFCTTISQVVVVGEIAAVPTDPVELDRLTLDRFARHACDGFEDPQRRSQAHDLDVVEERLQREAEHRVTDVDRDGDAVVDVQRRAAAAHERVILDVVVHEKRVVVQLERRRGREYRLDVAAERATHRDRQRGPQRLAVAKRIVEDEVVEHFVVLETMVEESPDLVVDQRAAVGHVATKLA